MELAFAGLHQLCSPLLDRLPLLPAPQREAAGIAFGLSEGRVPDRFLIGLAVLSLLSAAAEESPLFCVVDDAQWLDRASLQVLAFVARRLLADAVGLVFATREVSEELSGLAEVVVGGLGEADARVLLGSALHHRVDERVRDRIVAEAHGNPLALLEWPRGLTEAELAGGFGVPPAREALSGRMEDSFVRRLAMLPAATQRFLTVAAAEPTGDPVVVWRAAARLGVGAEDVAAAVDAGWVEVAARVSFRHPLVRSAAYRSAPVAERLGAHRVLAEVTDADADPDRRAWHRALASPGPDDDVAGELERSAGRAQARGGLAAAAALLERSVALTLAPALRAERALAAATAHLEAGGFGAATGLLAAAEAGPFDELGGARLDMLRGRLAAASGHGLDAPELYLRAAKRFESVDVALARDTYLLALQAACVAGELARGGGIDAAARAVRAAPASTNPPRPVDLILDGLALVTTEGLAAAAPILRMAVDAFRGDAMPPSFLGAVGGLSAAASMLWDAESCHKVASQSVELARDLGALERLPSTLNTLAIALLFEGDLASASFLIAEADMILETTGSSKLTFAAARLAALRGDEADATAVIEATVVKARAAGDVLSLTAALWASATLYNGLGRYDKALTVARDAHSHPPGWGSHLTLHELVEAAVRGGEPSVAAEAVERLAETTGPSGTDWALGIQARCEALRWGGAAAEDHYREAIERLSRTAIRQEIARSHLLYGEWLRRENRRIDARQQLRTAHEMLSAMGIQAFAERARIELLATGETVRKRTVETLIDLTSQELQIARLASDGRTNPEIGAQLFLSPRTVEWHLRKVFTKLNVSSRRQLRDMQPRLGQLAAPH
jgi:DNA-binding CsgD family transcriptional regulator